MRTLWFSLVLISLGAAAFGQNKQITVHAIDGRTGKPIAKQHLLVFGGDTPEAVRLHKKRYELTTDKNGSGPLTLAADTEWLQVWVDGSVLCQKEPNGKSLSVAGILATGVNTANTCGSVTEKLMPGRLIVFARPASLWEKMRK